MRPNRALVLLWCVAGCGSYGPNHDLRAASARATAELGMPVQLAYLADSTRLLVFVPDSLFADSAALRARSDAIGRAALRAYRRSAELDSVIVEASSVAVEGVARRLRFRVGYAVAALR